MIAQALSCVDPSKAGVAGKCAAAPAAVGNGVDGGRQQQEKEEQQQQQEQQQQEQQQQQRERQREKQCLALSNTDDNESLQGLVRCGGWLWLGTFGLPSVPPGEVDSEVRKRQR